MSEQILVTGASGALGRQVIDFLDDRVPSDRIAALAREPQKLAELTDRGISVRQGDYQDRSDLVRAFDGIGKLLLISATAFTDVKAQHQNVVDAAPQAGVTHIYYTAIQHPSESSFEIPQVTDWDRYTEAALAASGLEVTVLRNSQYLDSFDDLIGEVPADGVIRIPAGHTPTALATRRDMAEATAAILAEEGPAKRSYTLSASEPFTPEEVAGILGEITNKPVTYRDTPVAEYVSARVAGGMPEPFAHFTAAWFQASAAGEFTPSVDIEQLLGRSTTSLRSFLTDRRS